MGLTRAALEAIPRVKAERAVEHAMASAVGAGTAKDGDRLFRQWQQVAYPSEPTRFDTRARRRAVAHAGIKVFSGQ